MTTEEWRPVVGFPGYMVSDAGRVASTLPWRGSVGTRQLRGSVAKNGYRYVTLFGPQGVKKRTVHGLVAATYCGPHSTRAQVRHLDGNPLNDAASDLAWGTQSENELDKVRHGRHHNARKTHCKHGHEFTEVNTYMGANGGRNCRQCVRDRYYAKRAS